MLAVDQEITDIKATLAEHSQLIAKLASYDLDHHEKIRESIHNIAQLSRGLTTAMELLEHLLAASPLSKEKRL